MCIRSLIYDYMVLNLCIYVSVCLFRFISCIFPVARAALELENKSILLEKSMIFDCIWKYTTEYYGHEISFQKSKSRVFFNDIL